MRQIRFEVTRPTGLRRKRINGYSILSVPITFDEGDEASYMPITSELLLSNKIKVINELINRHHNTVYVMNLSAYPFDIQHGDLVCELTLWRKNLKWEKANDTTPTDVAKDSNPDL